MAGNVTAVDAYRAVLQTDYCEYVAHVHQGAWKKTPFHRFLTGYVQNFVERPTDKPYEILVLSCPPQHGKLLADDTPVLTRNGWKRHGELIVGDEVLNEKGEFVKVTHVFPKAEANRKVTFTNGEVIYCHENHEWVTEDRSTLKRTVRETKYMEKRISYGITEKIRGHRYNFQLPIKEPIKGEDKTLKVHPYVLGAWLGDGTNTKPCICAAKEDAAVLEEVAKHYPIASRNVHKDTGVITWYFKGLHNDLHEYDMCYYRKRTEKHIRLMQGTHV